MTAVVEGSVAEAGCWIWCVYGARETVGARYIGCDLRSPEHCQMLTSQALGRVYVVVAFTAAVGGVGRPNCGA